MHAYMGLFYKFVINAWLLNLLNPPPRPYCSVMEIYSWWHVAAVGLLARKQQDVSSSSPSVTLLNQLTLDQISHATDVNSEASWQSAQTTSQCCSEFQCHSFHLKPPVLILNQRRPLHPQDQQTFSVLSLFLLYLGLVCKHVTYWTGGRKKSQENGTFLFLTLTKEHHLFCIIYSPKMNGPFLHILTIVLWFQLHNVIKPLEPFCLLFFFKLKKWSMNTRSESFELSVHPSMTSGGHLCWNSREEILPKVFLAYCIGRIN